MNNTARPLMVLGTGSHVGKSIIVTALCRIFSQKGYNTAPFKAQNMSLNSWITNDGDEIGIAQAIQAKACGIEPTADMNPVLLKPKGDRRSQVIVMGKPYADRTAGDYYDSIETMNSIVKKSYNRLKEQYDIIVIEGAGGAAEINLYHRDIVNIGTARLVRPPVILVGDIERGGVFASIYGTLELLPDDIRSMVKGIIINKFRGDIAILEPGLRQLEDMTKVPVLGVIPYTEIYVPSEDSVSIDDKIKMSGNRDHLIDIAVLRLPRISNFTDFEPLEPYANIRYVELGSDPGYPDALIIPGTKNTIDDLKVLKMHGMDSKIHELSKAKVPIIGICGGYQMLGKTITDTGIEGSDGNAASISGLGLLNISTDFTKYEKQTVQVKKTVTGTGPILDYGGGAGVDTFYLANKGYNVHYFDISIIQREFVKFRIKKHSIENITVIEPYFKSHFDSINCISETYDGILVRNILEHVPYYVNLVKHLLSKLNSSGVFYEASNFGPTQKDPMHLNEIIPLEIIFKECGLELIFQEGIHKCWKKRG